MRWGILLCVFLVGCDDEFYRDARYADGTDWEPIVPASAGGIIPRDMNARQWSEFISSQGFQADGKIKTFTPAWVGFSVDPVGDISYYDFGVIVVMWAADNLVGTSDDTVMAITNLPDSIATENGAFIPSVMSDNSTAYAGFVGVESTVSRQINFYLNVVSGTKVSYDLGAFTSSGNKGLPVGWLIVYPKAR